MACGVVAGCARDREESRAIRKRNEDERSIPSIVKAQRPSLEIQRVKNHLVWPGTAVRLQKNINAKNKNWKVYAIPPFAKNAKDGAPQFNPPWVGKAGGMLNDHDLKGGGFGVRLKVANAAEADRNASRLASSHRN
jgi:hypothetical protein